MAVVSMNLERAMTPAVWTEGSAEGFIDLERVLWMDFWIGFGGWGSEDVVGGERREGWVVRISQRICRAEI